MLVSIQPQKAVSFTIITPVFDAEWAEYISGAANLDSEISQDGGSFSDCTNELTEIGSTGVYSLVLTGTETNCSQALIKATTTTDGAKIPCFFMNTESAGGGDATAANQNTIIGYLDTEIADIKAKTDGLNFTGNYVQAQVKGQDDIDFGATQKSSIQDAVEAKLTSANTELTSVPAATAGLRAMIQFIFEKLKHKGTMNKDTGEEKLYKDDNSTVLGSATHSDDGTTVTRGKML